MQEYKIIEDYLTPNKYSRPQRKLNKIKGIVIHWVANPNTSAKANRNFFENRKYGKSGYGSAHYIIGLEGEIIQCIPNTEMAYHVGAKRYAQRALNELSAYPNDCTLGIECCHPDWTGKFNSKTYNALINRVVDLLIEFDLSPSKKTIWRHYDVTGKDCPRYYVQYPKEWDKLVNDITEKYNEKVGVLFLKELANWQKELGESSIENLSKKGLLNNPEEWKNNLGKNVPQWLFWTMLDRITNIK